MTVRWISYDDVPGTEAHCAGDHSLKSILTGGES
jgi:hypothetical protein